MGSAPRLCGIGGGTVRPWLSLTVPRFVRRKTRPEKPPDEKRGGRSDKAVPWYPPRSTGRSRAVAGSPSRRPAAGEPPHRPAGRAAHPVPGARTVFSFHSLPSLRGSKRLSADNREEEQAGESSVTRTHARVSPLRPLFSTRALSGGGRGPAVPWSRAKEVPRCAGQVAGAPARVCLT